ncbi:MAG: 6-phosphogluconolactonase [Syntrophales bacterium]|jgi:glucosamine-6-phosphate deaminase|nr:6-phosphogluconolactonase [Syntrophales bacterium]MCK9528775.1 6-phosphogluconolactonase [Syntrophales bacterium]MDX9922485.1 6-phosphogluconolactonase [Syntrophales bacterium]
MSFKVIVTRDFDHMSEVAARLVVEDITAGLSRRSHYNLGLATGNTPTGLYKHLAKAANGGVFEGSRIRSFNLDEYVGLPGENAQQRTLHCESYSYFMIRELFGLMASRIGEASIPWGALIDRNLMEHELAGNPADWEERGTDRGKAIVIRTDAASDYLRWIRRDILDAYERKIEEAGGIDLHVIGIGSRGHIAFHEVGIPFEGNRMILVKLDENTIVDAVSDGHFSTPAAGPRYAISMGAELVYRAKTVLLLANGPRKAGPVAESLLGDVTCDIPVSYSRQYHRSGGRMIYVLDRESARHLNGRGEILQKRGIELEDISDRGPSRLLSDLRFSRDPGTGTLV